MPIFKPFRGIRPHSDILDIFPTRSINNFTEEELVKKSSKRFLCENDKAIYS